METIIRKTDPFRPDEEVIAQGAKILQQGGLVAFPTETVYGLGGNGLDADACRRIYAAKGRPSDNPLILHISSLEELAGIVKEVSPAAKKIIDAFWPGPITIIFPKAECVPYAATGGLETVAVRFPSHPTAQALIHAAGLPIAAPSANSSGKPSPTRASHVAHDLDGKIDMILDGGSVEWGLESTIVDPTGDVVTILRPGAITLEMLEKVVGQVAIDPAITARPPEGLVPKAPGMKYTHYAPKADVTLVSGPKDALIRKMNDLARQSMAEGKKTGLMSTDETAPLLQADAVLSLGSETDYAAIGAKLFDTLRQFDALGMDVVFSQVFSEEGEGMAIMNRLRKSAGYKIIQAQDEKGE